MSSPSEPSTRERPARGARLLAVLAVLGAALVGTTTTTAHAQDNGLGQKPLMGWSSWSFFHFYPTEQTIEQEAGVVAAKLASHGYQYVNLDDYWYQDPSKIVDGFGRWVANAQFPSGIPALADHVHGLGLEFGLYLTPGIPAAAVEQNTPIAGTSWHAQDAVLNPHTYEINYNQEYGGQVMYALDFSKPAAQAFLNSWADQLAAWHVDYLKLDGVGNIDGHGTDDLAEIEGWSRALRQSGRPIYFALSNSLNPRNAPTLKRLVNSWRIDDDIECYNCQPGGGVVNAPLTDWPHVLTRFADAANPEWIAATGPGGWDDLDSVDVGNGGVDGLTDDERQTMASLWTIAASPYVSGDELASLDAYGMSLLTNDEVIAVDQAGVAGARVPAPAQPGSNPDLQVWRARQPDGSYAVALFNLTAAPATVQADWSTVGFTGPATVRDLWGHQELGRYAAGFSASLPPHGSRLLRVTPQATPPGGLPGAPGRVPGPSTPPRREPVVTPPPLLDRLTVPPHRSPASTRSPAAPAAPATPPTRIAALAATGSSTPVPLAGVLMLLLFAAGRRWAHRDPPTAGRSAQPAATRRFVVSSTRPSAPQALP